MIRPERGDELELTVDSLAYGGAGVARSEGYVVFVRGGVPGDTVRARVTKSKRSFAEADSVELLTAGPDRIQPTAPHPGAPWQVLSYERQLAEKESQVRDALERIGGFDRPAGAADRGRRAARGLPQQAGVLVRHGRRGRAGPGLPPRGTLGPDRRRDERRAGLREGGRPAGVG